MKFLPFALSFFLVLCSWNCSYNNDTQQNTELTVESPPHPEWNQWTALNQTDETTLATFKYTDAENISFEFFYKLSGELSHANIVLNPNEYYRYIFNEDGTASVCEINRNMTQIILLIREERPFIAFDSQGNELKEDLDERAEEILSLRMDLLTAEMNIERH
jgi:hypothetical protein